MTIIECDLTNKTRFEFTIAELKLIVDLLENMLFI